MYQRPDRSSRSGKAGSHGGRRYGVGIDVCGWLRGGIINTRAIAETNREGTTNALGNGR